MKMTIKSTLLASAVSLTMAASALAEPVKIGMITTLSTGAGYLGEDVRDGFLLAVSEEGGKLGGTEVEVLVEDDGRKPGNGKQIADKFLKKDKVEIMTGVIFSNITPVVVPLTIKAGAFYVSPNSAPSIFAGKGCMENYFVASWQNDSLHESAGVYANELGYKNAYILAPNYQAGKDSLAGFKRYFKGEIAGETYTKLGQTDYAAEIAKIRDANPEMVFHFLPGGMGINFLKQYSQAGLKDKFPLVVSTASMDERIMSAVKDAAVGVKSTAHWSVWLENDANKAFVDGFKKAYGRTPTVYASQGYDAAKLIASALKATGGKVSADQDGFRSALKKADFASVRGTFKLANNNHPMNDWLGQEVVKEADGTIVNKVVKVVAKNHKDAYADQCALK
ncbi:MAG: ABC transporter substrate-binding protein [Pseudomonadota bacterium]